MISYVGRTNCKIKLRNRCLRGKCWAITMTPRINKLKKWMNLMDRELTRVAMIDSTSPKLKLHPLGDVLKKKNPEICKVNDIVNHNLCKGDVAYYSRAWISTKSGSQNLCEFALAMSVKPPASKVSNTKSWAIYAYNKMYSLTNLLSETVGYPTPDFWHLYSAS